MKRIFQSFRGKPTYSDSKLRAVFKKHFGFAPTDLQPYREALRHKSANSVRRNDDIKSNERLEYLGDAILGAIIARYLFDHYPNEEEGFLTKMRSKLVSRANLNKLAKKIDLNLLIEQNLNPNSVRRSLLGNALEALIGAIYLQKGFKRTSQIIIDLFSREFDLKAVEQMESDYKSKLLIWAQRNKKQLTFEFNAKGEIGPHENYKVSLLVDHLKVGEAEGRSKKEAEQLVAKSYCKIIFST